MKNLGDKVFIAFFFFMVSCSNCESDLFFSELKNNQSLFKKIIDVSKANDTFINNDTLTKNQLEFFLNKKEASLVNDMGLTYVNRINEVIVINFKKDYNAHQIEQKIDTYLDMSTNNKCKYYLFYHRDQSSREEVAYYAQYSECRYYLKNFENWTISHSKEDCSD